MASTHHFKPAHKDVKRYYEELAGYDAHQVTHETAVRTAFSNLLAGTCSKAGWHLVPEQTSRVRGKQVRPDGTLRDDFNLHRGYWEAKDTGDKFDIVIRTKIALATHSRTRSFKTRTQPCSVRMARRSSRGSISACDCTHF